MALRSVLTKFKGAVAATQERQAHQFAVVDVETTGLYPNGHDRIVEIAVVRTTQTGDVVDEYVTLINPNRDIGPTSIHGVTASDVTAAPSFEDVAGDVMDHIADSIVAGHNSDFDLRFLDAELRRIGSSLPEVPRVCTLDLIDCINPRPANGRLTSCCKALRITHDAPHSALSDARATAQLLTRVALRVGWDRVFERVDAGTKFHRGLMPSLKRGGRTVTRDAAIAIARESESYLERLMASLPLSSEAMSARRGLLPYLDLLDRALEDRLVSRHEAEALVQLAREWGLDSTLVRDAHLEYLSGLCRAAVADGVVTHAERQDLLTVVRMLRLSKSDLDEALARARLDFEAGDVAGTANHLAGQSVCFTGELYCTIAGQLISRGTAETLAASRGLVVKNGVSKKLDVLVVADPHTMSGKAKKAREYGTRVVAEAVFWQMINVKVD